ncbi:MAG: MCP four helix bundle domain-containing protein [Proteobacteria bacterium]|nr:MCP four helix bundle domain-containing protein [Pseudomonadota bacterium]
MRQFDNLSIRTKLLGGFAVVLVIALLQSLLAIDRLSAVNDRSSELSSNWLVSIRVLGDLNSDLSDYRLTRFKLLLADDEKAVAATESDLQKLDARMAEHRKSYQANVSGPEEQKLADAFDAKWKAYIGFNGDLFTRARAKDREGVRALIANAEPAAYKEVDDALDKLIALDANGAAAASADATGIFRQSRMVLLGGLALMIALGLSIGWFTSRKIAASVGGAARSVKRIADGDLSQPVETGAHDEIGQLLEALAAMQARLREIVGGVRRNAESVATASAEIAAGNNDLSARTEQQASALEETAASMEELSSTVRQNADNARQGNQLAINASTVARSGGEVVGKVVTTMNAISAASKKIADIIGVIDGIAFQTNILALNAAVEAARAGEQGRGFAVVAGEVRALAQRSADAAREIKTLIGSSVERVEEGGTLVDQAGTTMREVEAAIQRVTDIVAEITAASNEQATGVSQVGEAVTQMDQATQQNAALVEQSAAAAESLKLQAQQIVQAIALFKLDAGAAAPALAPAVKFNATPPAAPVAKQAPAPAKAAAAGWSGADRRGPGRAKNVARIAPAAPKAPRAAAPAVEQATPAALPPAPVKDGTDDWETF